ncbi:hypothetical protein C0033_10405 [Clostridium sp. chh4-2]|uniref:DUF6259 domain-containing protein n=1 Tax=Clostridium sp. chh4-2 TaxID=2067550 RepID=UPI000CCE4354|nr:DUF6259 domain-containing protein [Clostridium sp. chh4-2]PNV62056.1 hypothetical protein C0033_10405 [Clostridium sp. chh4-2]
MQELSFTFSNASLIVGSIHISAMIYTFTNVYSLDPLKSGVTVNENNALLQCNGLLTAGGQLSAPGYAEIRVDTKEDTTGITFQGFIDHAEEEIRSVKLIVSAFPVGDIINLTDARKRPIPEEGLRFKYPEGWRDAGTPLVVFNQPDGCFLYFQSLDNCVREKTFVFQKIDDTSFSAELIYEELATEMTNHIQVPRWEIGIRKSLKEIYRPFMAHIQQAYDLVPWEQRTDVPAWAREISLIAAIHGQHWTGYIFNDYAAILNNIKLLCTYIEPKRILVYLPGWEGRYYWKYGAYSPDVRMGGEEGFRRLCKEAKELGVHVMPMFGINISGIHHDGFSHWGEPSEMRTASGNINRSSVDWDASRHYDHSSNRSLNPGAPKWQNRLTQQILTLCDVYGFDGVFLDIAAIWKNDPNHNVYNGVKQLVHKLRQNHPELLIAGEGWYDGLSACIPLLQCGHTDGKLHWHDEAYPPIFDTYTRNFGHLCLGDPGRFSTGVHELGTNPQWRTPLRKGIIPTLTIVEQTLQTSPEKVQKIIQDAKTYAARFL